MCDYSVIARGQRDFQVGEQLVVTQLGEYTRGLTSPDDPQTAVCIPGDCGVRMMVRGLPDSVRKTYGLPAGDLRATFMTLNRGEHRDALLFDNQRTVLINELPIGLNLIAGIATRERRIPVTASVTAVQRAVEMEGALWR